MPRPPALQHRLMRTLSFALPFFTVWVLLSLFGDGWDVTRILTGLILALLAGFVYTFVTERSRARSTRRRNGPGASGS